MTKAEGSGTLPHLRRQGAAMQLIVRGKPLLLLAGEVHNSSASSLAYMEPILDRLAALHLNAVLVPLYWELIEPEERRFDFALLDGLVLAARQRSLQLVFLWFGTMKNAISCYAPVWVKSNLQRFPRAQSKPGESSWTVSPFCAEVLACDARAFAAVMRHLRALDGKENTVVMMQVENETGILGAARDHSVLAEAAFAQPVPAELMQHLAAHRGELLAEFAAIWAATEQRASGTWSEVFGSGAEEVFMAWHVARFVDQVAAAGRAEYDLPMFANAWLVAGPGYTPGQYPSGGPVSRMFDVWHAAAPHLDLLAPDIYHEDFRGQCESYMRAGNPLFIPEARNDAAAAGRALYAFGRHAAIGFGPFAIDDLAVDHPLGESYRLLGAMMPLLADAQGQARTCAFLQQADKEEWTAELGDFRFRARCARPLAECRIPGSALLLWLGGNDYALAGWNLIFTFEPRDPELRTGELLWLDEGAFENGQWRAGRRLNGDETAHGSGAFLGERLTVCRFRLHGYR